MARYTGPRLRISRRLRTPIFGPSKYLERKDYPPGQHGQSRRRKATDYALALMEKQKKTLNECMVKMLHLLMLKI